jgi:hypothetical protein
MGTVIANNSHPSDRTLDRSKAAQADVPSRRQTAAGLRCRSQFGKTTSPKMIGVMVFEQMTAPDLTGPAEAFPRVNQ